MHLIQPASFAEFAALAEPFLLQHEAEHGLLLGVIGATDALPRDGHACLAMDGEQIVALGLRKDDRFLVSREERPGAARLIAAADDPALIDRVLGPPASVGAITPIIPRSVVRRIDQGVYDIRKLVRPASVSSGRRRVASSEDVPILADFLMATLAEADGHGMARAIAEAAIARQIPAGEIHVWERDGEVVSSAAAVGPTRHAIRVNFVYTPPELRGRGYATNLVASLTEVLLGGGRDFVFLHADLGNATSNRICQRIGYRRVGEFSIARFAGS